MLKPRGVVGTSAPCETLGSNAYDKIDASKKDSNKTVKRIIKLNILSDLDLTLATQLGDDFHLLKRKRSI
jgi:hypothetical protein